MWLQFWLWCSGMRHIQYSGRIPTFWKGVLPPSWEWRMWSLRQRDLPGRCYTVTKLHSVTTPTLITLNPKHLCYKTVLLIYKSFKCSWRRVLWAVTPCVLAGGCQLYGATCFLLQGSVVYRTSRGTRRCPGWPMAKPDSNFVYFVTKKGDGINSGNVSEWNMRHVTCERVQ
jgi:hypothetical protein